MYKKAKAYILENNMIPKNVCVLAGVSGGGDSMTMLHMLSRLSREWGFSLKAVHVHHGIRGEEADRDAAMTEKICRQWGIPFICRRFDVPALALRWKCGTEEAGRVVRQKVFQEEGALLGGEDYRVALAHNQDDLGETLLHHLARGSGIRGLASMRPVSGRLIRPLLCLRRREIDYYLKENGIPYVTDSTNLTDAYTRNKIRHKILPLIEKELNPKACEHMAETARILGMAEDYFTRKGRELLDKWKKTDQGILVNGEDFQEEPLILSYVIMEAFYLLSGKKKDFSSIHVQSVLDLRERQVGSSSSLPYGLKGIRRYDGLWIGKASDERKKELLWDMEWEILPGEETSTPLGTFFARIFFYQGEKIPEKKYTKWLDYDKIEYRLSIRTRREGDFLVIDRKGNRKKLNRCMIDEKIPREERNKIPLLTCGGEVLWLIGGRINEQYKITQNTRMVLEVKYQGGSCNE